MADILIRGVEMPEYCYECPCHNGESGYCQAYKSGYLDSIERPVKCPLVPLPEGHGRLGDLEIAEAILHNKAFDLAGTSAEFNALNWVLRQIKALPTIVPAEGGSDDEHV